MVGKIYYSTEQTIEGKCWRVEWASGKYHDGRETQDKWLRIYQLEENGNRIELANTEYGKLNRDKEIRDILLQNRIAEIRTEYGIIQKMPFEDRVNISRKIIEAVWNGDWMAQWNNSYAFYIQNLADIFGIEYRQAVEIIWKLQAEKKIGLNGDIIIPFDDEQDSYRILEEETGHKMLELFDFGGWVCSFCGNRQDEYGISAKDIPCTPIKIPETQESNCT